MASAYSRHHSTNPTLDPDRSLYVTQERGVFDAIAVTIETPGRLGSTSSAETKAADATAEAELRRARPITPRPC